MTDDAVTKSSRPNEKVGFAWTGTGVNTFFGQATILIRGIWLAFKKRTGAFSSMRLGGFDTRTDRLSDSVSARDYSANGEEYIALCPCGQRGRSRSAVANSSKFSDYAHESRTRASQSSIEFYSLVAGCCLFRAQVW